MFGMPEFDEPVITQSTKQGPRSTAQTPLAAQNAANRQTPQTAAEGPAGINDALLKAANGGNPDAAFEIGERYLTGRGVVINQVEAIKWFEKAVSRVRRPRLPARHGL